MFLSEDTILRHGGTPVSTAMLDQANHSVHGKECLSCWQVKALNEFQRDSSYKEGVRDQCLVCESAPRLSTAEHTARLRERNLNSWAVKAQRWSDQDDFRNEHARWGRAMHHSELINKLRRLTNKLYFMDGRIVGDISVFRTYGCPQPRLATENCPEGRDFEYLMYIPMGYMPEFSLMEFNDRDVIVREKLRGWRTALLRAIKSRIITEEQCDAEFGTASGIAAQQWRKQLYVWRNGHA